MDWSLPGLSVHRILQESIARTEDAWYAAEILPTLFFSIPLTLKKQYYVCHIHLKRPPENISMLPYGYLNFSGIGHYWGFIIWHKSLYSLNPKLSPHRLAPVGGQVGNFSLHCQCSIIISRIKEELDKPQHKSGSYSPSTGFWTFENSSVTSLAF